MKLSNRTFDTLRWISIIVMPALATLVTVVFKIWGIPFGDEIAQTITAVATFLGAILMVSTAKYNRDQLVDNITDVPED